MILKANSLFFYVYDHRPDVTNRVFYHKLKDLMSDIRQNEYFGSVKALVGVIGKQPYPFGAHFYYTVIYTVDFSLLLKMSILFVLPVKK